MHVLFLHSQQEASSRADRCKGKTESVESISEETVRSVGEAYFDVQLSLVRASRERRSSISQKCETTFQANHLPSLPPTIEAAAVCDIEDRLMSCNTTLTHHQEQWCSSSSPHLQVRFGCLSAYFLLRYNVRFICDITHPPRKAVKPS